MAVAFVVIIASAYFGIRTVFVEDKSATVPGMVGMQLVDAVEALQKEGLLASRSGRFSGKGRYGHRRTSRQARRCPKASGHHKGQQGGSVLPILT